MTTIEQLESGEIVGNAAFDLGLWGMCDRFVLDETNTDEHRIRAMNVINKIVGMEQNATIHDVNAHVRFLTELDAVKSSRGDK